MNRQPWAPEGRDERLAKLVARNRSKRSSFLYEDAEWMRDAYVTRGLTLREVAQEADCGLRTIARWMTIHGIPTRTDAVPRRRTGAAHPKWNGGPPKCAVCGEPFNHYNSRTVTHRRCRDVRGERNSKWRGTEIEYTAMHDRVRKARGAPGQYACAHCGSVAQEWAYDHADPNERRNRVGRDDGPFSTDPNHYMPLCKPCHRKLDLGKTYLERP